MNDIVPPMSALPPPCSAAISEAPSRLALLTHDARRDPTQAILDGLRRDAVVVLQGVEATQADAILLAVARALHIQDQLEIQAGLAALRGHRRKIGKYFMTVNAREDFNFIPPHSEGSSNMGIQLAAFYCHANTTDGGHSILMNVDNDSPAWASLKELTNRGMLRGRQTTREDLVRARALHTLDLNNDTLRDTDQVIAEQAGGIPGLQLYSVLAQPRKIRCGILEREGYSYWDSIASIDFDSAREYLDLLRNSGLAKGCDAQADLMPRLDNAHTRRVWRSGVPYSALFRCKVTRKMQPRELLILNNRTWTHAASNWTPGSGVRELVAAFA